MDKDVHKSEESENTRLPEEKIDEESENTQLPEEEIDEELWQSLEELKLIPLLKNLMTEFQLSGNVIADCSEMDRSAFAKMLKGGRREFSAVHVDNLMAHLKADFDLSEGKYRAWHKALRLAAYLHHEYNLVIKRRKTNWDPRIWHQLEPQFWKKSYQMLSELYQESKGALPALIPALPLLNQTWEQDWGWIKVPQGYRVTYIGSNEYRLSSRFWPLDNLFGIKKIMNLGSDVTITDMGEGTYLIRLIKKTQMNNIIEPLDNSLNHLEIEPQKNLSDVVKQYDDDTYEMYVKDLGWVACTKEEALEKVESDALIALEEEQILTANDRSTLEKNLRLIEFFNRALKIDPYNGEYWHERGMAYYGLKQYMTAIIDFKNALWADPTYYQALYDRAFAYLQLGKKDKAIADFRKFLKVSQDVERRKQAEKMLDEIS